MKVTIKQLDSGFVVSAEKRDEWGGFDGWRRTAEPTLYGSIAIAARALGYHGTIEFGTRTVEVPVVGMVPPNVGIPFDDEELPLRAGAARPDDLL